MILQDRRTKSSSIANDNCQPPVRHRINIPVFLELRLHRKTPRTIPRHLAMVVVGRMIDGHSHAFEDHLFIYNSRVSGSGMGRFWGDISTVRWADEGRK